MMTWVRWMVWMAWLAASAWLWRTGVLSAGSALMFAAASFLLFAFPGTVHRRRRSALQYIEMGKQPVESP
jgi:hypothetical protein